MRKRASMLRNMYNAFLLLNRLNFILPKTDGGTVYKQMFYTYKITNWKERSKSELSKREVY